MMLSESKIGVAVVGLGVGARHARFFNQDPRCRLVSLLDHDIELATTLAAELSTRVAKDYASLLSDPEIEAVCIASFDDDHAQQTIQALKRGKHVFVEKPLCTTKEEWKQLKHLWEKQLGRIKLMCNMVLRAAPVYHWLRDRVAEGKFGEIYGFDGEYLYGRLHKITGGWRSEAKNYSVMLGGGIHMIDLMLYITNQRPTQVFTVGNRISTDGTQFRYQDYVTASFQVQQGLIGRITANFGSVHRHQHVVRLFGTKGTFIVDDAGPRVHWSREENSEPETLSLATLPTSKSDLIEDFVDAIVNDISIEDQMSMIFDGIIAGLTSEDALRSSKKERIRYQ